MIHTELSLELAGRPQCQSISANYAVIAQPNIVLRNHDYMHVTVGLEGHEVPIATLSAVVDPLD
jgi:hypothetical protein